MTNSTLDLIEDLIEEIESRLDNLEDYENERAKVQQFQLRWGAIDFANDPEKKPLKLSRQKDPKHERPTETQSRARCSNHAHDPDG